MQSYKYQINLYSPFCENLQVLNTLYLPIIGKDALFLYMQLKNEYNFNINSIISFNNNHNKLLKTNEINWEKFENLRKILESVNLMSTYINETEKTFYYVLKEPLNFEEFLNDKTMFTILQNRLSREELNQIKYSYGSFMQTSKMLDVSETINYLITETEKRDVIMYDIEKLIEKLSNKYHMTFDFSFELSKKIDDLHNDQKISFDEMFELVSNSIIKTNNGLSISIEAFDKQVNEMKNQKEEYLFYKTFNIKRDAGIFDLNKDISNFNNIIDDYKKYKSENYIAITTKSNITDEIKNWLKELRNDFGFSDDMINAIIDFTNIKNAGKLFKNYILSIAKSINSKAIKNVEETIEYLRKTKAIKSKLNLSISSNKNDNQIINLKNDFDYSVYDEEQLKIIKSLE